MATIDEIKQQAEAVKNATQVGENTAIRVGGALAGLADIAKQQDVELDKKADKTYVDTELAKKADKTYVDTELGKKADKTYVDTEIDKKADKETVNTELGKKADKAAVDAGLAKKADKAAVDAGLAKKADKAAVDAGLAKKADKAAVDAGLAKKADKTYVDTELGKKADKTYTDTELGKKFDKTSILQESGEAEDKVMSQKATTAELNKKLDKSSIVQESGDSEELVMSQKAVSDKLQTEVADRQKAVRDSLYTEKETKVVKTASTQGLTSHSGTYYVIETPIHVIYKCKNYSWGDPKDVCIGFLNKNKEVVKSWSKKDATKDDQGNWCFDVYSDDWEGAYYLRIDNEKVSLEIYKKPERNTIIDYISKVNFETYVEQMFKELVDGFNNKDCRVSENYQVDNGGNKRSLYKIKQEFNRLIFKLSASEIKEINSDVLYFYICHKEFTGGQYGHELKVSDGTNTINVTYSFKYNDRFRNFSIDFDYYEIDVSTLDKSKPWKFRVALGGKPSEFNKYRKFIRLSNKFWNGRDLWVESDVRGLINVFDNWAWVKSDDIPTLNDAIIATKEGGTLIIPKGDYNVSENCTANLTGNGVNDAVTIYKPITIIGDRRTRFVGGKAITSADLYDEENKIYVHNINDAENGYIYTTSIWICQDGTSDKDTAVVPSEMNALYHKRTNRMNMCSRIYQVNSIDAIKSASKPSFYIDTAANKMYFTIKDGTTLENNPVYIGRNPKDDYRHNNDVNLLIGPTHDVTIRNIDFAYGRIQVEGVENCTIENCITYGIPGNASTGFGISPTSKYVKIVNCEICGNSSDGLNCGNFNSPIGGNFIDTDFKGTGMSRGGIFVYMKDCWVHDNSDDGISEHGAGCFIIENSLLEYNGVSGCTVAGSDSNYIGCIFRKNAWRSIERGGFENLSNDAVGHCLVKDCVAIDNYGQADYSLRSMGLNSYTTFQNCKSIRTETEIPSWVSGYSTLNPVGFEVENKSVNHAVLMDCTSNRAIKTRFGSSADVKVFSGDNIVGL